MPTDPNAFPANPFRAAIEREKRPLVGIWSMLNSPSVSEGLGWLGFDWVLVDGEHAPVSLHDAVHHSRALATTPTVAIHRLLWNDPLLIKAHLDAGIGTIMLPFVQSAAEARRAVEGMHYAPRGTRGIAAMHRASRWTRIKDYPTRASETLYLIVQIETAEALAACEEIAAVDGVDAVFFGPGDLAASMGLIGQAGHPDVTGAIEDGLKRCRATGKHVGVLAPNDELSERHIRTGFDFVSVANDCALLFRNADAVSEKFGPMAGRR